MVSSFSPVLLQTRALRKQRHQGESSPDPDSAVWIRSPHMDTSKIYWGFLVQRYIYDQIFMKIWSAKLWKNAVSHNVEESLKNPGYGWLPKFNQFFLVHIYRQTDRQQERKRQTNECHVKHKLLIGGNTNSGQLLHMKVPLWQMQYNLVPAKLISVLNNVQEYERQSAERCIA